VQKFQRGAIGRVNGEIDRLVVGENDRPVVDENDRPVVGEIGGKKAIKEEKGRIKKKPG
jgi:hypothetical protein